MFNNYLLDENFLLELDNDNEKEISVKIIALSKDELPIETIEGRATGGSINIDGASAVRRTCSLTLVAQDVNINDYYWGLKNKFKLEIGLKNNINPKYPDIIWFKMGTYIITSFNTSQSVNSYTINISGKDKMCLLNGDLAGKLPHTTDFGMLEEIQLDGSINYIPLTIQEIVFKIVQELGGEFPHNIVINDLEDSGLELLEYRGDVPLYFFKDENKDIIVNMTINPDQVCYLYDKETQSWVDKTLSALEETPDFVFNNSFNPGDNIVKTPTQVKLKETSNNIYTIIRNDYGSIAGYRETPLIYTGTLIGDVGESLTSILDKIINMLGEFEYFYDLDGRFIFQKKPYTITTSWSQLKATSSKNEKSLVKQAYNFTNNKLISSFSNNPNLLNIRNDFSVWGTLKSSSGLELPIHARYAIDKKPKTYHSMRWSKIEERLNQEKEKERLNILKDYNESDYSEDQWNAFLAEIDATLAEKYEGLIAESKKQNDDKLYSTDNYDWRELIYQMALDYNRCYQDDNFYYNLIEKNPDYFNGKTGYEQYYTDIAGFWRELYNPFPNMEFDTFKVENRNYEQTDVKNYFTPCTSKDFKGVDFLDNLYVHKEYVESLIPLPGTPPDPTTATTSNISNSTTFIPFYDFCKLTENLFTLDDQGNIVDSGERASYYWFTDEGKMNQGTQDKEILRKFNIKELFVNQSKLDETVIKVLYKVFGIRDESVIGHYGPLITAYQDPRIFSTSGSKAKFILKSNDSGALTTKNDNYLIVTSSVSKSLLTENEKVFLTSPEPKKIFIPNTEDQGKEEEALLWGNKIKYVWKFFLFLKKYEELQRTDYVDDDSFIYRSFYIKNVDEHKKIDDLDTVVKQLYGNGEEKKFSWSKTDNWGDEVKDENKETIIKKENIIYLYGYYKFNKDPSTGNYWATQIEDSPETLVFWFDFLDAEQSELGKFSVPMIGSRTNPIKDDDVKTIYYRNIPNVIFEAQDASKEFDVKTGYVYIKLQNNMQNLFTISSKGKSAKERIDELLYKHTCCAETVNITSIPIYYLDSNQKIIVKDNNSNINGEYIIDKLSYSLNYNGMMTISATKIYDNLF